MRFLYPCKAWFKINYILFGGYEMEELCGSFPNLIPCLFIPSKMGKRCYEMAQFKTPSVEGLQAHEYRLSITNY